MTKVDDMKHDCTECTQAQNKQGNNDIIKIVNNLKNIYQGKYEFLFPAYFYTCWGCYWVQKRMYSKDAPVFLF